MKLQDRGQLNKLAKQRKSLIANLDLLNREEYVHAILNIDFYLDKTAKRWWDSFKMELSNSVRYAIKVTIKKDLEVNRKALEHLGVTVEDDQ